MIILKDILTLFQTKSFDHINVMTAKIPEDLCWFLFETHRIFDRKNDSEIEMLRKKKNRDLRIFSRFWDYITEFWYFWGVLVFFSGFFWHFSSKCQKKIWPVYPLLWAMSNLDLAHSDALRFFYWPSKKAFNFLVLCSFRELIWWRQESHHDSSVYCGSLFYRPIHHISTHLLKHVLKTAMLAT